jgi:hypothetical protein
VLKGLSGGPVGSIRGLPGSDCDVPLSALDINWQRDPAGVMVTIRGLAAGKYLFRSVDGHLSPFTVPAATPVYVPAVDSSCLTRRVPVDHAGDK